MRDRLFGQRRGRCSSRNVGHGILEKPGSWFAAASDRTQNLLECVRLYLYPAVEGVVEDADHVQEQGDQHRQARYRHDMQPDGLYPKEVGKSHRQRSSGHENDPYDVWYA